MDELLASYEAAVSAWFVADHRGVEPPPDLFSRRNELQDRLFVP